MRVRKLSPRGSGVRGCSGIVGLLRWDMSLSVNILKIGDGHGLFQKCDICPLFVLYVALVPLKTIDRDRCFVLTTHRKIIEKCSYNSKYI